MSLQACTKILVLVSVCVAELAHAALATQTPWLGVGVSVSAFTGMAFLARWVPRLSLMVVLITVFIVRGLFFLLFDHLSSGHFIPVSACLLGVYCAHMDFSHWGFPRQWTLPLVLWALIIALSWPVVFLRELDFTPVLTLYHGLRNNGNGVQTEFSALWVARTAVIEGVGFLWLEFLCCTFRGPSERRFESWVLLPLAASFCLSGLVALYQAFFDLTFWNLPHWINARRAIGLVMDGNGLGVSAAFWVAGFFVLGVGNRSVVRRTVSLLLMLASLLVLTSSASNGAFVMTGFPFVVITWFVWRHAGSSPLRRWMTRGVALLCVVCLAWGISRTADVTNQWERFLSLIPSEAGYSPGEILRSQLRDRPFFAMLSLKMFREAPVSGTGMASFHTLANDYGRKYAMADHLPFDSALNWYAQQLTEYGIVGSMGWIAWIAVFTRTLLLPLLSSSKRVPVRTLQAVLVGFGVASCFNVTAKNPEIVLTFWTFVFWLSLYVPPQASSNRPGDPAQSATREFAPATWVLVLSVAVIYAFTQLHTSVSQLRVPDRAAMADWNYEYGFSAWKTDAEMGPLRLIGSKAVTVLPVNGEILRFEIGAPGQESTQSRLEVKIWRDSALVIDTHLSNSVPVPCEIAMKPGQRRTVLQFAVGRRGVLSQPALAIGPWQFPSDEHG